MVPGTVCSFYGLTPTLAPGNVIPTFYVEPTNAASFSATGAFKSGISTCSFYEGSTTVQGLWPWVVTSTSTATVTPYITWTGANNKGSSATCSPLTPAPFSANKYTTYDEIECALAWSKMSGTYTLAFSVDAKTGPTSVTSDKFVVWPASPTQTITSKDVLTTTLGDYNGYNHEVGFSYTVEHYDTYSIQDYGNLDHH
ncbi:uncharacterized protein PV09_02050 [Verruconis gallopava]|uniref:Uncharacterized protein n=1 Tax=Verruconis gallopava TaxID=253628 RepID=A0A0D2AJZ8_9PEZI|nr:uncharacterized protein PV09_02050 [Verruconis gallopava]KIW07183.1 hypothetical protein PV09_02050 [Verruconis gallopava]